jgi:hypothetical protein
MFIELTDKNTGKKMFVNVNKIAFVDPDEDIGAFINFSDSWYPRVKESYDEVRVMIEHVIDEAKTKGA